VSDLYFMKRITVPMFYLRNATILLRGVDAPFMDQEVACGNPPPSSPEPRLLPDSDNGLRLETAIDAISAGEQNISMEEPATAAVDEPPADAAVVHEDPFAEANKENQRSSPNISQPPEAKRPVVLTAVNEKGRSRSGGKGTQTASPAAAMNSRGAMLLNLSRLE
jgi:hypothetical protein